AEALSARRGGPEEAGAAVVARQHGVRDVAGHHDVRQPVPGDVRLDTVPERPVADDDQPRVGDARLHELVSAQNVSESLALFEPADEKDVDAVVAQVSDRWVPRMKHADVDPVGNNAEREVRKVTVDKSLRGFAHRDSAVKVREVRLEDWAAVEI